MSSAGRPRVGVLALQGSFREHCVCLEKAGASAVEVRKADQLPELQGLVIPGGESTTMALIAERWNLLPALREFAASGRPVWGTCAGLIFLADRALGQKQGGQQLVGGLDVTVSRNYFGSQVDSFETQLSAPECLRSLSGGDSFRAVFIRAPAIMSCGPSVEVLADITATSPQGVEHTGGDNRVMVAVRQGHLLGTAFHPELTADLRWHQLFVRMCEQHGAAARSQPAAAAADSSLLKPTVPLPVF